MSTFDLLVIIFPILKAIIHANKKFCTLITIIYIDYIVLNWLYQNIFFHLLISKNHPQYLIQFVNNMIKMNPLNWQSN